VGLPRSGSGSGNRGGWIGRTLIPATSACARPSEATTPVRRRVQRKEAAPLHENIRARKIKGPPPLGHAAFIATVSVATVAEAPSTLGLVGPDFESLGLDEFSTIV